jgi:hypothetical protein
MVYSRSFFPMFPTLSRSSIRGPMLLILCACSLAAAAGQELKEPLEEPLADLKLPTMLADASEAMGTEPGAATEGKADNYEVCASFRADIDADLGVYMGEKLKGGALIQHYWDYAGDGDANDVNMTNIQAIYYWSLNETTSIGAGPNIIANWEQDNDNTWTVPVGIGINRAFQFGKIPVRIGLEYFHTVVEPDDVVASDWSVRFFVIPAAPSALFDWMQS